MSSRKSYSLLDSITTPAAQKIYPYLHIPNWFPPEAIVITGWLSGIIGSVGIGISTSVWWGGIVGFIGIGGNYFCDLIDGHHARQSNQCRNGGEMLDRFFDFLSFASFFIAIAFAANNLVLGIFVSLLMNATSNLNKITDKYLNELNIGYIGPAEVRSGVMCIGLLNCVCFLNRYDSVWINNLVLYAMLVLGVPRLIMKLVSSYNKVNNCGVKPDTAGWELEWKERYEKAIK